MYKTEDRIESDSVLAVRIGRRRQTSWQFNAGIETTKFIGPF